MLLGRPDRNAVRVKRPRELAGVVEADADGGFRLPRHPPAAEEALKVDHQVEPKVAQPLAEPQQFLCRRGAAPRVGEPAALEADDVEAGQPIEQPRARGRDEPRDLCVRPVLAQQVPDGQRVHDVADRARLDEQDPLRRGWKLDRHETMVPFASDAVSRASLADARAAYGAYPWHSASESARVYCA